MPRIPGNPEVLLHNSLDGHENNTILRYMSLEQFKVLLSKGLHLTRADNFTKDDPFEGEFAELVYNICEQHNFFSEQDGKRTPMKDSSKKDAMGIRELSYVSCWTLSDNENVALWRLYGNIAVQTTVTDLKAAIEFFLASSRERNARLMNALKKEMVKVAYIDHRTTDEKIYRDMIKTKPITKLLHYKNVGYQYEGEVRVIFYGAEGCTGAARELGQKCYLGIKPQDFVHKILISPFADNSFFSRVKNEMELHGPEIHKMSNLVEWSSLKFPPGAEKTGTEFETI
ncbi:MAG: hypothetical protein KKA54_11720 [Proteobacteria bacterium]|nr:hypothetical protein [Pseudomonadota bacterium]MBU0967033.1 hypothetical protein [Pseudomonadota bacterium]